MGKSGLIAHVFNRAFVKSNFKTFSIDLYPTSSLAELILLLAKEITGPLKSKGQSLLESFLGIVKSPSVAFCKKHSMKSPSTVQSALRVLHDKGIVRKDGNSYSVTNRLLGIWLAKEY